MMFSQDEFLVFDFLAF